VEERGRDTLDGLGEELGRSKEATNVGEHEKWIGPLGEVLDTGIGKDELEGVGEGDATGLGG